MDSSDPIHRSTYHSAVKLSKAPTTAREGEMDSMDPQGSLISGAGRVDALTQRCAQTSARVDPRRTGSVVRLRDRSTCASSCLEVGGALCDSSAPRPRLFLPPLLRGRAGLALLRDTGAGLSRHGPEVEALGS